MCYAQKKFINPILAISQMLSEATALKLMFFFKNNVRF